MPYSFVYNTNVSLYTYLPNFFQSEFQGLGNTIWITKPTSGVGGEGIQLFNNNNSLIQELSSGREIIVQKYIENPLLINGYKFDIRVYVLITGNRILMYPDGYARVSPLSYSKDDLNKDIHMTNMLVHGNKVNILNFDQIGINKDEIYSFIKSIQPIFQYALKIEQENKVKIETFELFGIDMMFDSTGKAWLLEINKNPGNLHITHDLIPDVLKEVIYKQPTKFIDLDKGFLGLYEEVSRFNYIQKMLNASSRVKYKTKV